MNNKVFLTCILGIILVIICLPANSYAGDKSKPAPIPIIDFEGTSPYDDFDYAGPKANEVDYEISFFTHDLRFIKQGKTSRMLKWELKSTQYFGWGVNFKQNDRGLDFSQAVYLTFWVIGLNGSERFEIKIKDTSGNEVSLKSYRYITSDLKNWRKVIVPLRDFGEKVDRTRLENINLGFNRMISGEKGCIYIDDFKFEY